MTHNFRWSHILTHNM